MGHRKILGPLKPRHTASDAIAEADLCCRTVGLPTPEQIGKLKIVAYRPTTLHSVK